MEPGRPVGGTYYLYRTLRNLDLDGVLERLMQTAQNEADGGMTPLEERLARDEYEARIDKLRKEIEAEIRRRLVADRGAEAMAKTLRKPLPEDIDFMHASRDELRAAAAGDLPADPQAGGAAGAQASPRPQGSARLPQHRAPLAVLRRRAGRAQVPLPAAVQARDHVVVADISGSVAAFARFTLQLVYAISSQFSKVRSFVFIDGIDEVTSLLRGRRGHHRGRPPGQHRGRRHLGRRSLRLRPRLRDVLGTWGKEITPKTTVILLGDARNNYHASQAWVVAEMRKRARHVYWLNPEPRSYWDTGDSIVSEYAIHCDGVFECRNLKQLERFVEHLA